MAPFIYGDTTKQQDAILRNGRMFYDSSFRASTFAERVLREGRILAEFETPAQMIERVVSSIFLIEMKFGTSRCMIRKYMQDFGGLLDKKYCVMSTPIMTNAGRYTEKPLAACVVPPVDLRKNNRAFIRKIINTLHADAIGTGFNLNVVDDPVSMLRYLNSVAVAGAISNSEDRPVGNIAVLSVYHPKILDFIRVKVGSDERGEVWKFNISVDADELFMDALRTGRSYQLWNGRQISAEKIFNEITYAAYQCGDPGLVFIKRMNRENPTPGVGEYVSTAPCGETGLAVGESCQFGYINLGMFLSPNRESIDLSLLERATRLMTRVLDNALEISIERSPYVLNQNIMKAKRKIGIGICGLADLLIKMRIPYGSCKAQKIAMNVVGFINYISKLESHELAKERGSFHAMYLESGCAYNEIPGFIERKYGDIECGITGITKRMWRELGERIRTSKLLRNASTTTLPPTGRSGLVIDASTGVEPLFSLAAHGSGVYYQLQKDLQEMVCSSQIIDKIRLRRSIHGEKSVPLLLRAVYKTALEVSPIQHLRMVAALQKVVDDAISKTINIPEHSSVSVVRDLYMKAYDLGLKGITVFRDGSRRVEPISLAKTS